MVEFQYRAGKSVVFQICRFVARPDAYGQWGVVKVSDSLKLDDFNLDENLVVKGSFAACSFQISEWVDHTGNDKFDLQNQPQLDATSTDDEVKTTLNEYVNQHCLDTPGTEVTAFIVHEGPTQFSGHYISYVKRRLSGETGEAAWYEMDDARVTKLSIEDARAAFANAYLITFTDVEAPGNQGSARSQWV